MTKGTPSMGKKGKKKLHIMCRRCGSRSYNMKTSICSSCGYGKSSKMKRYAYIRNK